MADDGLAYGHYPEGNERGEGERSLVGDTFRKFQKNESVGALFNKLQSTVSKVGGELENRLAGTQLAGKIPNLAGPSASGQAGQHRYDSFAQPREGNDVKWHVDGCAYFWAVSVAIERARESIWILDWWLSPELYLRRPPSQNEQYRIDRMLQAAAQRGVKVNVIVYKEVSQALTRKLSPIVPDYLHSLLPRDTDPFTSLLTKLGIHVTFTALEAAERENPLIDPPVSVSSVHTKHALEALHPNIAVFRHPDHLPDAQTFQSSLTSSVQNFNVTAAKLANLPGDALKALYGVSEDVILYWAHHEKLCLIDGHTAFMGGLDLCYGRWDTNQHAIADAHPEDLDLTVFPGQEYNNARILDFSDVEHWDQNKLDRKESSRMGWSDISISIHGPVVQDLRSHFVGRWNFIYNEKYDVRKDVRYSRLSMDGGPPPPGQGLQQHSGPSGSGPQGQQFPPPPGSQSYPQPSYAQPPGSASQQQSFPPPPGSQSSASYQSQQPQTSQGGQYGQQYSAYSGSQHPQGDQSFPPPPPGPPPTGNAPYRPQQEQSYPPPPPGGPPSHSDPYSQYDPAKYSQGSQQSGSQNQTAGSPHYQAYHPQGDGSYASGQSPNPPTQGQAYQSPQYFPPPPSSARGFEEGTERGLGEPHPSHHHHGHHSMQDFEREGEALAERFEHRMHLSEHMRPTSSGGRAGGMHCQIVRSCTKWSNGSATEHSIQNAYVTVIRQSQHFVYIENQFFITATGSAQRPVQNQIGAALVERIIRAARAGEKYKVFVLMPAVPAFAGDLKDESSLGTRAIMEFQYNSINRGGHSIMEEIRNAGFEPTEYIRFYNLRNYDRINAGSAMRMAEQASGVDYETARREHDAMVDPIGFEAQQGEGGARGGPQGGYSHQNYDKYQQSLPGRTSSAEKGRWDSVSECYMLGGRDIREVPWQDGDISEIDSFVSEELYIHSKVLIADDRIVICGSANLNDRSQLGNHDSEIACVIEDGHQMDSFIDRRPWRVARFAATLRRFLMRKHLGLVRPQDCTRPDDNYFPAGTPNNYDYDSPEDRLVADPLADQFLSFWNNRARTNTYAFGRIFHAVPHDDVRSWLDYDDYYEKFFKEADKEADGKTGNRKPAKYRWGHVVTEKFSPGEKGVKEVKDMLSTIKGTLVEMPLLFLIKEDIAKQGLSLNAITEPIYT